MQCWQDRRSAWKNTSTWYSTTAPNRITLTGRSSKEPCQHQFTAKFKCCLASLFAPLLTAFRSSLLSELRVRIEPQLFRVVDLAVYRDSRPEGRYGTNPAFVAIEIVSPDDRHSELTERLEDYRRWGVPHVWLVDPQLKRVYEYTEAGLLQFPALRLPEFDFEISAQELFKDV